jgi:hypothetical protein
MMISRFIAALCVLGPFTCSAHADGINGEATYVSSQVPGALGTYPMSINNSMTVTGYYYVTPTVTRGFARDAEGTITTFDVGGEPSEPIVVNISNLSFLSDVKIKLVSRRWTTRPIWLGSKNRV